MTDKEIINSLKGSILNAKSIDCNLWTIDIYRLENILDLINRQQAEIERLKPFRDTAYEVLAGYYAITKAEAIKEFAERLKNIDGYNNHNFDDCASILISKEYVKGRDEKIREIWNTIDNLVKEMMGDTE